MNTETIEQSLPYDQPMRISQRKDTYWRGEMSFAWGEYAAVFSCPLGTSFFERAEKITRLTGKWVILREGGEFDRFRREDGLMVGGHQGMSFVRPCTKVVYDAYIAERDATAVIEAEAQRKKLAREATPEFKLAKEIGWANFDALEQLGENQLRLILKLMAVKLDDATLQEISSRL